MFVKYSSTEKHKINFIVTVQKAVVKQLRKLLIEFTLVLCFPPLKLKQKAKKYCFPLKLSYCSVRGLFCPLMWCLGIHLPFSSSLNMTETMPFLLTWRIPTAWHSDSLMWQITGIIFLPLFMSRCKVPKSCQIQFQSQQKPLISWALEQSLVLLSLPEKHHFHGFFSE